MTKTIVTGVDGSETAAAAADRAAELAAALGARLHNISASGEVQSETVEVANDKVQLTNESDAQRTAWNEAEGLRSAHPGVLITAAPAEGKPGEALVRVAEEVGADLIVVGNKRVQGLKRIFGSIARHIAANAQCDLYIAHTHPR